MKKLFVVILAIGLMMVGLTGCGSKQPATTSAPAATDTKAAAPSGGTDLSSIMKSASKVKGMSFDMVSTITGKDATITTTGKVYISDTKVRMEITTQGMQMITISKAPGEVYLYNPTAKTAMKVTTPVNSADIPNQWAKANGDVSGLKVIGEENKDGFDCVVVNTTADNSKMWIRKDIGMPVRMESTTAEGTMVVEYKNYNIGAQADSLFELPEGTQITAMPDLSNIPQAPK